MLTYLPNLAPCLLASLLLLSSASAGTLKRDFQGLLTYRNLGLTAAGMAAAGLAHRWDDDMRGTLDGNPLLAVTSCASDLYGESGFNVPAAAGLWLFARATRHLELQSVCGDLLRALGFTQLLVAPVKFGVRRERPDGGDRRSFPSGHAANAFAIAGVLHRRCGPRVGLPLYAFGALVGAGRMAGGRHYLSDVIAGATLGGVVGLSISRTQPENTALLPMPAPGGWTLTLRFR